MRIGFFDPQHIVREKFAEAPVNLANAVRGYGPATKVAIIEPPLHRNMRLRLKLKIALGAVRAVVVF
jgi:hypothetical protein